MTSKQANRAGRPWQRKDGRWAARAYPLDGGKPRMVYGATEAEALDRQHEIEAELKPNAPASEIGYHAGTQFPARPPKPVRFTLDLDQDRHAFLKQFALECGAGTGGAAVLRALLDELREGSNLPVRVRARIWAANK